jgi:hypothetical protein
MKSFIESAVPGEIPVALAGVPFAHMGGDITIGFKYIPEGGLIKIDIVRTSMNPPHTRLEMMPPGQGGGAGRGTERIAVEIGELHGTGRQCIQMRRLQDAGGIQQRNIFIALIIGLDQDNIGLVRQRNHRDATSG